MFKNAKVGDKVWDFLHKKGIIAEIENEKIFVEFYNVLGHKVVYDLEGRILGTSYPQTLFWGEIKYDIPEKSFNLEEELRKLEIAKFELGSNNYTLLWSNQYSIIDFDYYMSYQNPLTVYFTKKSIMNFLDSIKDKEITKEEFFEAYGRVFGGK